MSDSYLPRLLEDCRAELVGEGVNLWGVASARDFDAAQPRERRIEQRFPGAVSLVVIGSGGRGFWERMTGSRKSYLQPSPSFHPIDDHTVELVEAECERLRARGHRVDVLYPFERHAVDFVALGEMAGLGTRSPAVPLLLHPEFGPWISMRAALVLYEELPVDPPLEDFTPCSECLAPCLETCPAKAVTTPGLKDDERCASFRSVGGCEHGCDVRAACVYGREHAYGVEERAFRNAYVRFELERYYGLGRWRFVPAFLRRRR